MRAGLGLATVVAIVLVAALTAAPATASSIAYVGSDGNLWLTTPDGARQHRVTSDGGGKIYTGPAQLDDGTVIAAANDRFFYVLNPNGSTRSGPWLSPTNGSSTSPVAIDVAPSGGLIAYWHLFAANVSDTVRARVAFANSNAATADQCSIAPCHDHFTTPRWVPGRSVAAMVDSFGSEIAVQSGGGGETGWLQFPAGVEVESFDLSRTGYRALIASHDTWNGDRELTLWDNKGMVPPAAPSTAEGFVCGLDNFSSGEADVRWSPDGSSLTWSDSQGVWVSPTPTVGSGNTCVLQPRLIAAGGKHPDWSAATVPGSGGTGSDTGGGSGGTGSGTGGGVEQTAAPTLAVDRSASLAKSLKKGLPIVVGCAGPCDVSAQALAKRRNRDAARAAGTETSVRARLAVVGRAKGALDAAGELALRVKFTKKARRSLRKLKKVPLTIRVTAAQGDGATATASTKVTLRR